MSRYFIFSQFQGNLNFTGIKNVFMVKNRLSSTELAILILCAIMLAAGFILFYSNRTAFDSYVQEDGIVEWGTVLGLLAASIACFTRFIRLFSKKSKWFLFVTFFLGLFLFFSAGEEISWGQRIAGIETPEYFQKNNAQQETNLHNLVVDGVKINKLIFSIVLVSALCIYLVVVPVLYNKVAAARRFFDLSGVPIPRLYQVIGFILVFGLTSLIPDGKRAELLECTGALLMFLIILFPVNKNIFQVNK